MLSSFYYKLVKIQESCAASICSHKVMYTTNRRHGVLARGGGVLRFELDGGVLLEPQNPYPSLRVILAEKGTHF